MVEDILQTEVLGALKGLPVIPRLLWNLFFSLLPAPSNPDDRLPAHQLHLHWAAINQRHWHSRASVCAAARCVLQQHTGAQASCITPGLHYLLCCAWRLACGRKEMWRTTLKKKKKKRSVSVTQSIYIVVGGVQLQQVSIWTKKCSRIVTHLLIFFPQEKLFFPFLWNSEKEKRILFSITVRRLSVNLRARQLWWAAVLRTDNLLLIVKYFPRAVLILTWNICLSSGQYLK